jgi:hypothetical protein
MSEYSDKEVITESLSSNLPLWLAFYVRWAIGLLKKQVVLQIPEGKFLKASFSFHVEYYVLI